MAPNADRMCRELGAYLASRLEMPVTVDQVSSWQERESRFDAGDIDLCWICGVPYVEKVDKGLPVSLSVAPVMQCERYGDEPVYFSDVIVRADSPHRSFSDLYGKRWAFNEPRSHSGFNVVCYRLATLGHTLDYFETLVQAGTHQAALRMVISGDVAGAAIDSTVIEAEARNHPELLKKVRAIAVFGPSPAPPWVFSPKVSYATCTKVTRCLADMHRDRSGAAVLATWGIQELRVVTDDFYDPIRHMMNVSVRLAHNVSHGTFEMGHGSLDCGQPSGVETNV